LYAIVLAIPADRTVTIKSLASGSAFWPDKIGRVRLLGGGRLKFTRDASGLCVTLPETLPTPIAFALKIQG
ncbi:MAG TPA: alpha-L-fucosidase C-terminal domain-containing protein, partial [Verrucomicrobiae bacterium]|nr:alpha-L-fucosidase C-terminal domain-containing protein [Verrucomicrobiae bacterium]